jgi:hypothetical protein
MKIVQRRKNMYKLTVDLAPFTPEQTPRRSRSLRRHVLQQRPRCLAQQDPAATAGCQLSLTPELPRREPSCRIHRTPEATARLSSVLEDLSALSHELSINLESGGFKSTVAVSGGTRAPHLSKIIENLTNS